MTCGPMLRRGAFDLWNPVFNNQNTVRRYTPLQSCEIVAVRKAIDETLLDATAENVSYWGFALLETAALDPAGCCTCTGTTSMIRSLLGS